MTTDKNALKAGLFILGAVVAGAGLLVALQGSHGWFEPVRTVTAEFDLNENLGGLKPGDPVRVGGFDQGRVSALRYLPGDKPHIEVDFTLPQKYDLRSDAVLTVEQGLTGTADLNVTDFGHARPYADGTPLDGRPSAIATLYALGPELTALVRDVHAKVDPAYARYDKTVAHADDAVVQAKSAMKAFSDFLGGSGPDLHQTLANLNQSTATLKDRLPGVMNEADKAADQATRTLAEVRDAVHDARPALDDARAALANARQVTDDARTLLTRNKSRIDHILESGREAASNLEGASAEIRSSPWRLLYKPSRDEIGNLAVYDTTRQFARAAAQLDDAASAVRDAAADPKIDHKDLQAMLADLKTTFGKYREAEQSFWAAVK